MTHVGILERCPKESSGSEVLLGRPGYRLQQTGSNLEAKLGAEAKDTTVP